MKKQAQNHALIALLLIVIGAVVVAFMLTKENLPVDNVEVEEHLEAGPTQNFNTIAPEAWAYADNAVADIQALTPGQVISYGIVQSKNDQGVYYFITSAPDPKNDEKTLWSFYQYNSDYTFERVYRLSLEKGEDLPGIDEDVNIEFQPVGPDDYELIILARTTDLPVDPCEEPLAMGRGDGGSYEMLSLDLLNPYHTGLQPYTVPEEIYIEAHNRQNECFDKNRS